MMSKPITKKDLEQNNKTTFPNNMNEKEFNEWNTYDNTELRATENNNESWHDVDKLKELYPDKEVYLITLNESSDPQYTKQPLRAASKERERYNFAFDFAITNLTDDDKLIIHYWIMKYRSCKIDDPRTKTAWNKRVFYLIAKAELEIFKHPYTEAHFT